MSSLDEQTRRALGQLLRELRQREGLTLRSLSEQVGVSQSALSQFEAGRAEPALGTLWKLGRALNASLFDFFAGEPAKSVDVTTPAERTVIRYERARYEAIARSTQRKLDLFVLHLEPGTEPVREPVSHAGEEAGLVLSGTMDVHVDGVTHRLEAGDGIWFVSDQQHTFSVVGDEPCVSVWADTLPDHAVDPNAVGSVFDGPTGPTRKGEP